MTVDVITNSHSNNRSLFLSDQRSKRPLSLRLSLPITSAFINSRFPAEVTCGTTRSTAHEPLKPLFSGGLLSLAVKTEKQQSVLCPLPFFLRGLFEVQTGSV